MSETVTFAMATAPSVEAIHAIAIGKAQVALSPELLEHCQVSENMLRDHRQKQRLIYGVNSGFGPLAGFQLPDVEERELQKNLIYHLATGLGDPFDIPTTRAIMAARLASLSRGYSAVPASVLLILQTCLNQNVTPCVPSLGTVGASGDLTPLAHVALALIGEGECWHQGQPVPAKKVLAEKKVSPLQIQGREALALVNGVSAMTGLAVMNQVYADRLFQQNLAIAFGFAEALNAQSEAYHPLLGKARPHPGQQHVHQTLRRWQASSRRLQKGPFQLAQTPGEQPPHQDPYTLRCLPQIYGAIHDVMANHRQTVGHEIQSASDNPLFFTEKDIILHGGNFYGQHIAFASDSLAQAALKMALHLERCISRICHPQLQTLFPAFLNAAKPGLHSGFMGAQVTATALAAHLRGMAIPMATQTIPTNGDNQDIVSMGTLAALKCSLLLERAFEVTAIAALTLAQAMDLAGIDTFSKQSQHQHKLVRGLVPPMKKDVPLSKSIQKIAQRLRQFP